MIGIYSYPNTLEFNNNLTTSFNNFNVGVLMIFKKIIMPVLMIFKKIIMPVLMIFRNFYIFDHSIWSHIMTSV